MLKCTDPAPAERNKYSVDFGLDLRSLSGKLSLMKVPNCRDAEIPRNKITEYLLCLEHPEGAPKARFFMKWGFSLQDWNLLASTLIRQVNSHDYDSFIEGKHGTKYIVIAPIESPTGTTPPVKTIWMVAQGTDYPRLISAYPAY